MLFTLIFMALFVVGWSICALAPWVAASVMTRGGAGLAMLPLCLVAGNVSAMAVPLLGFDGRGGLVASFVVAAVVPALLIATRRFALGGNEAASGPIS